ncbi:MAG: hypothetical protein HQL77_10910, partial [Magnetococcales bacterium]|nr:hypothetical protein [Magnetococcales bacterium]
RKWEEKAGRTISNRCFYDISRPMSALTRIPATKVITTTIITLLILLSMAEIVAMNSTLWAIVTNKTWLSQTIASVTTGLLILLGAAMTVKCNKKSYHTNQMLIKWAAIYTAIGIISLLISIPLIKTVSDRSGITIIAETTLLFGFIAITLSNTTVRKISKLQIIIRKIAVAIILSLLALLTGLLPQIDSEIIAKAITIIAIGIIPTIAAGSLVFLLIVLPAVTFFPLITPAVTLGVWLRLLGVRIIATFRHPISGLYTMPHNCYRILLVINYKHPLDLPPAMVNPIKCHSIPNTIQNDPDIDQFNYSLSPLQLKIVTLITFFYRLFLKAICWPYFPFLWIIQKKLQNNSQQTILTNKPQ